MYILLKALADCAAEESEKDALEKYLFNEDKFNRYGIDEKSKLKLKPVKTDNDQLQLLMSGQIDSMDKSKNGIIYHNYMLFKELINVHRIFGVTGTNGTKSFVNPIKNPPSFA